MFCGHGLTARMITKFQTIMRARFLKRMSSRASSSFSAAPLRIRLITNSCRFGAAQCRPVRTCACPSPPGRSGSKRRVSVSQHRRNLEDASCSRFDRKGYEFTIGCHVKQFLTIPPPTWIGPASILRSSISRRAVCRERTAARKFHYHFRNYAFQLARSRPHLVR